MKKTGSTSPWPLGPSLRALTSLCIIFTLLIPLAPTPAFSQSSDTSVMFEDAYERFKNKNFESAIVIFRRIFEIDPNPFVLFNIGRCHEELGQLETAVQYYDRSLKIDGLPQEARVDAIQRIEKLTPQLKQRKTFRVAMREANNLVDRSFYVAQNDAKNKATRAPVFQPPPPKPEASSDHWTWIGGGTIVLGVVAVGIGGFVDANIGDKLTEQEDLIRSYQSLGDQALIENDPAKAEKAITDAARVNDLADDIESDQQVAGVLVCAGTVFILSGITMLVLDSPLFDAASPEAEESSNSSPLRLVPTHNGVGITGAW